MKLASEFSVPAPPDRVLPLFLDAATMRACIPGCVELERLDEAHYRGRLVNEIAHVRFSAGFSAAIESLAESGTGPADVKAVLTGEDRRLASSIKVYARLTVRPDQGDGRSTVGYEFDMALWGKLGRMGEPVIRRRTAEVERQFVASFTAACQEASGQPVSAEPSKLDVPAAAQPARQRPSPRGWLIRLWHRMVNAVSRLLRRSR